MGFYQNQIVPILTDLAMRQRNLAAYRSRVVPAADGRVLEIGVGSGLNLPFYSPNVRHLIGLDPSPKLLSMARRNLSSTHIELKGSGSHPFGKWKRRYGRDDVDVVQYSQRWACASRNVSGIETCGTAFVCGTWTCSPAECMLVAGPSSANLETPRRRLSS
jgi:hypothetical protein